MRAGLITVALTVGLTGCGVPIGGFLKPPTSLAPGGGGAVLSGIGVGAFVPRLEIVPTLSTGEQDDAATGGVDDGRGLAGHTQAGVPFRVGLSPGTAAQVVVAGPARSDLVLGFMLGGIDQRVDGDPLSPDLSVESFVVSTDVDAVLEVRATDFRGEPVSGLLRWYAFVLPSSTGTVRSGSREAGPAGTIALPGRFEFTADQRGRRLEVLAVGGAGTDLSLRTRVGGVTYVVDDDPQRPNRAVEGFVLEVDDPATVTVDVTSTTGGSGDVRWAVLVLPPEDRSAPR